MVGERQRGGGGRKKKEKTKGRRKRGGGEIQAGRLPADILEMLRKVRTITLIRSLNCYSLGFSLSLSLSLSTDQASIQGSRGEDLSQQYSIILHSAPRQHWPVLVSYSVRNESVVQYLLCTLTCVYSYPSGTVAVLIYSHIPGVLSYLFFNVGYCKINDCAFKLYRCFLTYRIREVLVEEVTCSAMLMSWVGPSAITLTPVSGVLL